MPVWRYVAAALVLAAPMIGGCGKGTIAAEPDPSTEYPRVTLSSESLAEAVRMNPSIISTTAGGLMKVTQPIRAAADHGLAIEYKIDWFDVQGELLGPRRGWEYKRLEPRVPDYIVANASSDRAVDFRLAVRWARD